MRVPLSYLNQEFARGSALRGEIMAGIETLVDSGDFTLGKDVAAFEKEWAAAVGTEYAIGVRSGTDAIALALLAATGRYRDSPRPGGKARVITTPLSFLATAGAILQAGAEPLFVDTDDRLQINTQRAGEMACNHNVAAVLPVSWAGEIPWDYGQAIPRDLRVPVILDAAQAIGCTWPGGHIAPTFTAAAYSLHPLKNINVWGDGGMVATNDPGIDRRIRSLRNHGLYGRDLWVEPGFNARLESIQAVVGRRVLKYLPGYTSKRRHNALSYDEQLADIPQITIPPRHAGGGHVYHLYIVLCEKRDDLIAYLNDKGVEARAHYPIPLHLQPALRGLGHRPGDFPNAEYQAAHCVSLPVHQYLTEDQIAFACETVREFYG